MGKAFRTSVFGGFRKKDVIAYLETLGGPAGFDGTLQEEGRREDEQARAAELERRLGESEQALARADEQVEKLSGEAFQNAERIRALEAELAEARTQDSEVAELRRAARQAEAQRAAAEERAAAQKQEFERCEAELRRAMAEQRLSNMEKQWQESCRTLHETDRRAQELTLAIRCEGTQRPDYEDSIRRAERLLAEFRQELDRISAKVEHLAHSVGGQAPEQPSGKEKLTSPDEILHRVSGLRGPGRD